MSVDTVIFYQPKKKGLDLIKKTGA